MACIDLTSLTGHESAQDVRQLVRRARAPLDPAMLDALGVASLHTAALCVYPAHIAAARDGLAGSSVRLATVAAGFPTAAGTLEARSSEVRAAAEAGVDEIDAVIDRDKVRQEAWDALYDEVRTFREAAGRARLKAILGTGDLPSLLHVRRASLVCLLAGAAFIKTSTGNEAVNATLEAGVVMLDAITDIRDRTGRLAGFKPAGGIRTADQALDWLALAGAAYGGRADSRLFRFGASSLLDGVTRRLRELATSARGLTP